MMDFVALQSVGNSFAVVDAIANPHALDGIDLENAARDVCTAHNLDGVLYVVSLDEDQAAASGLGISSYVRVVNADGSYGQVSGNGARCVTKLLVERGHESPDDHGMIRFGMGRRLVSARPELVDGVVGRVSVDLGPPVITLAKVPVDTTQIEGRGARAGEWTVMGRDAFFVSVGNPHMVMIRDDAWALDEVQSIGREVERCPAFPEGMNLNCAQRISRERVSLITFERGVGLTDACGSGALATAIAGREMDLLDDNLVVEMEGGEISVAHHAPTGTTWTAADVARVIGSADRRGA